MVVVVAILVVRVVIKRRGDDCQGKKESGNPFPSSSPHVHVEMTERFHSGNTPEFSRQHAVANGSQAGTVQDTLDPIYNYSQASGASGISGLSDSDMYVSNPPSPAVSSICREDNELDSFENSDQIQPAFPLPDQPEFDDQPPYNGQHLFSNDHPSFNGQPSFSYPHSQSSVSTFGIRKLLAYDAPSDYSGGFDELEHSSSFPGPLGGGQPSSLTVPRCMRCESGSSEHTVQSDKTHTTHHSNHSDKTHTTQYSNLSTKSRESRKSESHYQRHGSHPYLDEDTGSQYSGSRHNGSYYSGNHTQPVRDRTPCRKSPSPHRKQRSSQSRSRSPNPRPNVNSGLSIQQELSLRNVGHYQSQRINSSDLTYLPEPIPMRTSRSDEHIKRIPPNSMQRQYQTPQPDPWAKFQVHRDEYQPPHTDYQSPPSDHQPPSPPSENTDHVSETGEKEGVEIIDEVLLITFGCLLHQENCHIPRCPCKKVKERFRHLLPQARIYKQREAEKVIEEDSRGEFDASDRKGQMRLSLMSQNLNEEIHPHYHITSRSHICQSRGMKKVLQRRRSRSMDLTPVAEHPESTSTPSMHFPEGMRSVACATTPGLLIPEGGRKVICSSLFSPAVTPSGEQFRILSPTTPSATQAPVVLHEVSLSADNIPALCLNDCPITGTPLGQHFGNRMLGGARSFPDTQRRWSDSVSKPSEQLPPLEEQSSVSTEDGRGSARLISQESSSSVQTTSTQSSTQSSKSDNNSVFSSLDGITKGRDYDAQVSSSTASTTGSVNRDVAHNHQKLMLSNKSFSTPSSNESGYGTAGDSTDLETNSLRLRQPPKDLRLSPAQIKKSQSMPREATTIITSQAMTHEGKKLLAPRNGHRRTGSTSSHSSHTSHHSNGSIITETLC